MRKLYLSSRPHCCGAFVVPLLVLPLPVLGTIGTIPSARAQRAAASRELRAVRSARARAVRLLVQAARRHASGVAVGRRVKPLNAKKLDQGYVLLQRYQRRYRSYDGASGLVAEAAVVVDSEGRLFNALHYYPNSGQVGRVVSLAPTRVVDGQLAGVSLSSLAEALREQLGGSSAAAGLRRTCDQIRASEAIVASDRQRDADAMKRLGARADRALGGWLARRARKFADGAFNVIERGGERLAIVGRYGWPDGVDHAFGAVLVDRAGRAYTASLTRIGRKGEYEIDRGGAPLSSLELVRGTIPQVTVAGVMNQAEGLAHEGTGKERVPVRAPAAVEWLISAEAALRNLAARRDRAAARVEARQRLRLLLEGLRFDVSQVSDRRLDRALSAKATLVELRGTNRGRRLWLRSDGTLAVDDRPFTFTEGRAMWRLKAAEVQQALGGLLSLGAPGSGPIALP